MIIQCNSCQKSFNVPDNAITEKGRLVQCSACGNKWTQYLKISNKKEEKISANKIDITFPLYISFYCGAKGKGKIIKDIYIDNIWGTTSWQNVKSKVFNYYVPNNLYLLPKLGYNYFTSRRMLIMYLIQRIKLESRRFFSIIKFSLK